MAADVKREALILERALLKSVGGQPTQEERRLVEKAVLAYVKSGRADRTVQAAVADLKAHITLREARAEQADDERVSIHMFDPDSELPDGPGRAVVVVPVEAAHDTSDWAWVPRSQDLMLSSPPPKAEAAKDATPDDAQARLKASVWEKLIADELSSPAATEPAAPAPDPAANGSAFWSFWTNLGYIPPLWRVPIGGSRALVGGRR